MKKIGYFSPYFWPEQIGSAPYCTDVAVYMQKAGADISIFAFRPAYPRIDLFSEWANGERDDETYERMRIIRTAVVGRGDGGTKERIFNDLNFFWQAIKNGFSQSTNSMTHVVAYVPGIICAMGAAFVAWRRGARFTIIVHDIESGLAASLGMLNNQLALKVLRLVERSVLNRADDVIVLTEGMAEELRALGCKARISVLPIWSKAQPRTIVRQTGKIKIGYSGNFGKKQNLDQLLPLIGRIIGETNFISVSLRGEGSERNRIESSLAKFESKNIEFLPLVPQEELFDVMSDVDIHLVPQALNVANYALPSKLISIMSVGRPFVCIAEKDSPLDQIAEESGAGVCVYPDDEDGLYEAVLKLATDPVRMQLMGDRGREYVAQNMDREVILKSYLNIISGESK